MEPLAPYELSPEVRTRALMVRWQHDEGRICEECMTGGRCPRLALWLPVIHQIEAQQARASRLQ